jgi:hypothetical protein
MSDSAKLFDDVEDFAGKFLAFPNRHCLTVLVLWIVHTWALTAFYVTPRLVLDSPEPGSGKTRVLEILALLCRSAKLTLSTTTAALYRRIAAAGEHPPTVLQDEADAVFTGKGTPQAEELRALFNAGYKRGATVDRCEGDSKNMVVREFPVFAPVALAGLAGRMPATITDRAVTLHMRRRAPDEHVAEFRERDATSAAKPLKDRIEAWAAENLEALTDARPTMPDGVRDRPAEVWEALLAIADMAGGGWPHRARAACKHFVLHSDADALSFGVRLLRDIRSTFGDSERMSSADLIAKLTSGEESEWADLWGKPLDQQRLAKELKRYGVHPDTMKFDGKALRGYHADGEKGLAQAWHRYLPHAPTRNGCNNRNPAGQTVAPSTEGCNGYNQGATTETSSEQPQSDTVAPVAPVAPTTCRCGEALLPDNATGLCAECRYLARQDVIVRELDRLGGKAS